MRIAIITTSQIPSTTANSIQVMKVCQAYRELGHEVVLIVPGKKKATWDEISKIYGVNKEFGIKYVRAFRIFRRYDFSFFCGLILMFSYFDVMHTWLPQIAILAGILRIPFLMELHGLPTGKLGPFLHKKLFMSHFKKRFLVITHALKNLFENEFNFRFHSEEIIIAPNGVAVERYHNVETAQRKRDELRLSEKFLAVYTGHLYQGRGMSLLVELAERMPGVNFLWVGGRKEDVQYWKNYILSAGLENITLTGFVNNEEIPTYQLLSDVLLMPYEKVIAGSSGGNSVEFCSPMKMFEYMAAGKPIITSDLPIIHEVLHEKNAIFCEFDKVDQWKNAIELLRSVPEAGAVLGNRAKQDVIQFSWVERTRKSIDGFPS